MNNDHTNDANGDGPLTGHLRAALADAGLTAGGAGRHPDYTSPDDAALVLALIADLGRIRVSDDDGMVLPYAEREWRPARQEALVWRFGGTKLAAADWNPGNVRISGGRARIAAWPSPLIAARWFDAACFALELIAAGWPPPDAESLAKNIFGFAVAGPADIDTFTHAARDLLQQLPGSDPRRTRLLPAARRWDARRDTLRAERAAAPDLAGRW